MTLERYGGTTGRWDEDLISAYWRYLKEQGAFPRLSLTADTAGVNIRHHTNRPYRVFQLSRPTCDIDTECETQLRKPTGKTFSQFLACITVGAILRLWKGIGLASVLAALVRTVSVTGRNDECFRAKSISGELIPLRALTYFEGQQVVSSELA